MIKITYVKETLRFATQFISFNKQDFYCKTMRSDKVHGWVSQPRSGGDFNRKPTEQERIFLNYMGKYIG